MSTNPWFHQWYRHCPHCKTALKQDMDSASCAICSFVFYDNPAPTATVLPIHEHNILLARRARDPFKGQWNLVGGFLKPGETFEEAAHRETLEETGLTISSLTLVGNFVSIYGATGKPTIAVSYLATLENAAQILSPQDDVAELSWFAIDQPNTIPEMCFLDDKQSLAQVLRRYS